MFRTKAFAAALVCASVLQVQSAEPKQIIFILKGQFRDHINFDLTEKRIDHALATLEQLRADHPSKGIAGAFLFSGSVSDALATRPSAEPLLKRIKAAQAAGLIDIGYDGSEEPTLLTRPRPNYRQARTPEQRWAARVESARWFLEEYKDPIWGDPDANRSGGLKRTGEVFGDITWVRGATLDVGDDSEYAWLIRQKHPRAIMDGLRPGSSYAARNLHGYGAAVGMVQARLSDCQGCAVELYFQDSMLRLSDVGGSQPTEFACWRGKEALSKYVAGLDRSRMRVIQLELAAESILLPDKPALAASNFLQYAYDHPKMARWPDKDLVDDATANERWNAELSSFKWLLASVSNYTIRRPSEISKLAPFSELRSS
jgi:hypothetical protein